ncbi:MAG: hypothetical protein IT384_22675 [Deltaproteobacteria bacterium]|nr:hypothetical protein [Deltaproteobacteria bacterium]
MAVTLVYIGNDAIQLYGRTRETEDFLRSFAQWILDRYDCTIEDDFDNDLTDEVGKDASILFPPRPPPKERPRPPLADRPDTSPADAPQLMAAEVASGRATERRAGDTIIWEYADGTVVRFRPHGDDYHPKPFFTIEVKRDTEAPYSGPDSAAFRVDAQGRPVPRNGREIAVPSDLSGPIERRIFIQYLLRTGERELGS